MQAPYDSPMSPVSPPTDAPIPTPVPAREWKDVDPERFHGEIVPLGQPAVLRCAARDWPLVRHFRESPQSLVDYLARFDSGELVMTTIVPPQARGRMVYEEGAKELNHRNSAEKLPNVLKGLLKLAQDPSPPGVFMGGFGAARLAGLQEENCSDLVPPGNPAHLWIGNAVTVSPHFDAADNLAFVVAGRRRFTLFPPDQVSNLYIGPFDLTPAGLPISMVWHDDPDFARYLRFRDALAVAQSAELEPGDALYIPYLWWHGVQSLDPFNMLVNYWWYSDDVAAAHPYGALLRATFELFRNMPAEHRKAWKHMYDHWVFETNGDPAEHLPPAQRTAHRNLDAEAIERFRKALAGLHGSS
jgi:hypothetical protein